MLRPAVNQIISKNESCYSLVIAVAKRAREIADSFAEKNPSEKNPADKNSADKVPILEEKPVKTAVEEIASGKYKIVYNNSNHGA